MSEQGQSQARGYGAVDTGQPLIDIEMQVSGDDTSEDCCPPPKDPESSDDCCSSGGCTATAKQVLLRGVIAA